MNAVEGSTVSSIHPLRKGDKIDALTIIRKHVTPSGQNGKRKGSKDGGGDVEMIEEGKKKEIDDNRFPPHFSQVRLSLLSLERENFRKTLVMFHYR